MIRYWVSVDKNDNALHRSPRSIDSEYGITANSREQVVEILKEELQKRGQTPPQDIKVVENVSLGALDVNHVVPNMGNPALCGIWFPLGYSQFQPWWRLPATGIEALTCDDQRELNKINCS